MASSRRNKKRSKKWKPSPVSTSSKPNDSPDDFAIQDVISEESKRSLLPAFPLLIGTCISIFLILSLIDTDLSSWMPDFPTRSQESKPPGFLMNKTEFNDELQKLIVDANLENSIISKAKLQFQQLELNHVPVRLFKEFIPDPTGFENMDKFISHHEEGRAHQVLYLMTPEIKRVNPYRLKAFVEWKEVGISGSPAGPVECIWFYGNATSYRYTFEDGRINLFVDISKPENYTMKFVYYVPARLL